ncbi:transposase [Streptomyces capoamus]
MIFEVVGSLWKWRSGGCGVARPKPWQVDDELWAMIEPLSPKVECRTRYPGRERHPDRLVFQGMLFVLHTGIAWEHLPQERVSTSTAAPRCRPC